MEILLLHETDHSFGGHDYLTVIGTILDADGVTFGSAIQSIEVVVNFKPIEHVKLMYDELNNCSKEKPDYLFQRRNRTMKIIYLSMVSSQEEEDAYFRGQRLDAEKFNELCYELRDYLEGIKQAIKPSDDFNLNEFLDFVDERFAVLPLSEAKLNSIFDKCQAEREQFYRQLHQGEKEKFSNPVRIEEGTSLPNSTTTIEPSMAEPDSLPIDKIGWIFGERVFESFDEFVKELTLYSWDCTDTEGKIEDFVLCESSRVKVQFLGTERGRDSISKLEAQIECSGNSLSFLEFMFLANNKLYEYVRGTDHVFYEGYEFLDIESGIPVIRIAQGS